MRAPHARGLFTRTARAQARQGARRGGHPTWAERCSLRQRGLTAKVAKNAKDGSVG